MDVNEKLFKDSHFRLLEFKKNNEVSNSVGTIRELICLSNVHCSDQNMTVLGAEKYKSELFTEYFKVTDSKNENGLLSVVNDIPDKQISCAKSELNQTTKECLVKFNSLLNNFGNKSTQKSEAPKLNSTQLSNRGAFNLFHATYNSVQPPNRNAGNLFQKPTDARNNPGQSSVKSYYSSVSKPAKEKSYSENTAEHNISLANKLSKKNKCAEQLENNRYKNKKVCVQSKPESKETVSGFVSASTLYRNPLKKKAKSASNSSSPEEKSVQDEESESNSNEAFKNFDKKIVNIVLNEIMDFSPNIKWDDIAGLDFVKTTVQEIVIWPLLRPDIFTGLRAPPRGILLFGPPGTGKTLIGKCIATESNSTFFCISASSLASKWVGESEQMVRVLFAAARMNQPAVIFIDEIDSLLSQRSDKDQDFTRKLKTEFLVQFDGAKTNAEERVLVVGATNRPHELDEAARRRFVKRLFVPLPDESARKQIIQKLLDTHQHGLSSEDLQKICNETEGYSGSDVAHLCKEAAMGPIRSIGPDQIKTVSLDQVRPISLCDFIDALRQVRASVVADDLNYYKDWNKKFGSFGIPE